MGRKIYVCEICKKQLRLGAPRFGSLAQLQAHTKIYHPEAPPVQEPRNHQSRPPSIHQRMHELIEWVKGRAVPGPEGDSYREVLQRAKELGLLVQS